MDCINLKLRFGSRFKVRYEESYYAERGNRAHGEEPWLMIVHCQYGHICPWGGQTLAACTDNAGRIAKKLERLKFTTMAQDGDDGVNILFHGDHFEEVAQIMRPRRRRRLSASQRENLRRAGEKTRFQAGLRRVTEG